MEKEIKKKSYKGKLLFLGIFIIISASIITFWYFTNKEVNLIKSFVPNFLITENKRALVINNTFRNETGKLIYERKGRTVDTQLFIRFQGQNFEQINDGLYFYYINNSVKFGFEKNYTVRLFPNSRVLRARYVFTSSTPIIQQGHILIFNDEIIDGKREVDQLDLSDICNIIHNDTSTVFDPQCNYNQIDNNNFQIDFNVNYNSLTNRIFIDPEFSITDGASSGTISTTCSSPTTILSVSTNYPASPNILIAFVQAWSTDTGTELINMNGLILKSGSTNTMLVNNSNWQMGAGISGGATSFGHFIFNHSAPANEIYNITACSSATAVVTEAKLLILNNLTNFTSNYTSGTGTTTYNNVSWLTTSYSGGKNVILSAIHVSGAGSTMTRFTANIKNSSGSILNSMSRPNNLSSTATTGANSSSVFLMAYDVNAPSNAQYYIEINNTGGNYFYKTESVVFQVHNASINTSSSSSLSTGLFNFTTLSNVNLSRNYTYLATGDFVDLDSSTEILNPFEFLSSSGTRLNSTQNPVVPVGVTDGGGAGIFPAIMMERKTNDPTLNTFYLRTNLSATTWNAKGTILAFTLPDNPTGGGGGDPCAYTSGDYSPPCNCVISSNIIVDSGRNVYIPGTTPTSGSFTLNANLTNYKNITFGVSGASCNITINGKIQNG